MKRAVWLFLAAAMLIGGYLAIDAAIGFQRLWGLYAGLVLAALIGLAIARFMP